MSFPLVSLFTVILLIGSSFQSPQSWRTFTNPVLGISVKYPLGAKILMNRIANSDSSLTMTISTSEKTDILLEALVGERTILRADITITRDDLGGAASSQGFVKRGSSWCIPANPRMGPETKAQMTRIGDLVILKGLEVCGQLSVGDDGTQGFAEMARIPLQFVYLRGRTGRNVMMIIRYDQRMADIADKIAKSMTSIQN